MFNNNAVGKSLLKFVVLLAIFNLVSCGGSTSTLPASPPPATVSYTITAAAGSNGSVTPSGVTTVAQGASQSYTITPNSGFAVATLLVDGATVAKSTTHTFTNVRANHTISATFSAAQAGDIALSLVPARTSGVAPLAVFFDASGSTDAGVTDLPFHDLEYTWDFGDPTAGTWAYGAQPGVSSKNSATGPVAAHVFEQPGTYSVSVTAFDGTNTVTTSKTITVDDPDVVFAGSSTVCVSTSGTFANCPSGASHVTTSNFVTAMGNISSSVKQILFNRGETFAFGSTYSVTQAGPGLIGAYGTGAKPVMQANASASMLSINADDWRIMDLTVDGNGHSGAPAVNNGRVQITQLRLTIVNGFSLSWTDNGQSGGGVNADQYFVHDNTSDGMSAAGIVNGWIGASRLSFQGNHADNGGQGQHVIRMFKVIGGVVSNNELENPLAGKHCLKLHSANPLSNQALWDGTYTEKVVIADNTFSTTIAGVPWEVAITPQSSAYDERFKNIIFERNSLVNTIYGSNVQLGIEAVVGASVRNNIFNLGANMTQAMSVMGDVGSNTLANDLIYVYNNTFYSTHNTNPDAVVGVLLSGGKSLRVTVRNNLIVDPTGMPNITWNSGFAGTLTSDHNLASTSPSAVFVNGTPTVPADFALKSGSAAITYGLAVPNFEDFIRATRSTTWDAGAYAY
jgi:hypothetical protein